MKYYEKNYDSTSTLQYNIQYIKAKTIETAAQNGLDSLKKAKEMLIALILLEKIIAKERDVKRNLEFILKEKVIHSLGLRDL